MSKENQSKKIGMSSGTHRNDFFVSFLIDQSQSGSMCSSR